jgi:autotransporter translocation and assembly factor TamB
MKIFFKLIAIFGLIFMILTSAVTLYLQTNAGNRQFTKIVNRWLEKEKITVEFEKIGGFLPYQWSLTGVKIRLSPTQTITFDQVTLRPYFFRLLAKQIALHTVQGVNGQYRDTNINPTMDSLVIDVPYTIYIKHFSFNALTIAIAEKPVYQLNTQGSLRIDAGGKKVQFTVSVNNPKKQESSFEASFRGEKDKLAFLEIDAGFQMRDLIAAEKIEGVALVNAHLSGSWAAFNDLITGQKERFPIFCTSSGSLYYLKGDNFFFPYPLSYRSSFTLFSNLEVEIPELAMTSPLGQIDLSAQFNPGFAFDKAQFKGSMQPLFTDQWDGFFGVEGTIKQEKTKIIYSALLNSISGKAWIWPYDNCQIQINGDYIDGDFLGRVQGDLLIYGEQWKSTLFYQSTLRDKRLSISNLELYSPFSQTSGNLVFANSLLQGDLNLSIGDLSQIQPFFPIIKAFGSLEGNLSLFPVGNSQGMIMAVGLFDTIYEGLHTQNALLTVEVEDLFQSPIFDLIFEAKEARFRGLQLEQLSFATITEGENWPFSLSLKGQEENPIDLLAQGFWGKNANSWLASLQNFEGFLFDQPFFSQSPIQLEKKIDAFSISPFLLEMPEGKIEGECLLSKEESKILLESKQFPLSFLSLNPWNLTLNGNAAIALKLTQKKKRSPELSFSCIVNQMDLFDQAEQNPIYGNGSITAALAGDSFTLESAFDIREQESMKLSLKLPARVNLYPFNITTHPYGNLQGSLDFDAKIQDILDYINIGPHRLEGDLTCQFKLSGVWNRPSFQGKATFFNGRYENYYTGTRFTDISALFGANGQELIMTELKGTDGNKGTFKGEGMMTLSFDKGFPFTVSSNFDDLELVHLDIVKARANGNASIKGNKQSASAKGKIVVTRADFSIPDSISFPIPTLDVTYVNQSKEPFQRELGITKKPYPLSVDFTVSSDNDVFITGRGLTSQWNGDFLIGGTYDNILPRGKLELVKGNFVFAGKTFDLTNGLLTFSGESNKPPYLQISGKVERAGITIITQLKGDLTSPKLSFRSLPPHPVSAVLSYLIFGQDISEISPIQAAQLAATAASLTGEGTDILELTRKSLGLDRLAVISTPTKEGVEGAALQIGKYLTKGVLFSISQGPDPSSGNVSIEVDLTHGFIFEAETIQQQEQGKFSLKWHKNY